MQETTFRFSSKKEYEDEMVKIITANRDADEETSPEFEEYEKLMAEYIKFCDNQETDGK